MEREAEGYGLKTVQDIDISKLSNHVYNQNAEKILTSYVLTYKGKDNSGTNLKDLLIDTTKCDPTNAEFSVEILRWGIGKIGLEVENDIMYCENWVPIILVYVQDEEKLTFTNDGQEGEEFAKGIINYLNKFP